MIDGLRTMLRRVRLVALDDAGTQQKGRVRGLKGEELDEVVRIQHFGLSSNPPADAEGVLLALGGRSDRGLLVGLEHKDFRPVGGEGGSTVLYDANGSRVALTAGVLTISHAGKIVLGAGGATITLEAGKVTIAGDVQINGSSLKHNAKSVGDTHVHTGVTAGPANTSVPA
jgi:phage baseplate assembly protein V